MKRQVWRFKRKEKRKQNNKSCRVGVLESEGFHEDGFWRTPGGGAEQKGLNET